MKVSKGSIVFTLSLLLVAGAFGAVDWFYFAEKRALYRENTQFEKTLQDLLTAIKTDFGGAAPAEITSRWESQVAPWQSALEERTKYFSVGAWEEHAKYDPAKEAMLHFWYDQTSNKMVYDFYQEVQKKLGMWAVFPPDLRADIGVAMATAWAGLEVDEPTVNKELAKLSFGIAVSKMLLNANAKAVTLLRVWPESEKKEYGNVLKFRRIATQFSMTMKDLVTFFEDLRTRDQFFTVESLRLTYSTLAYPQEPMMNVELLLGMSVYNASATAVPGASTTAVAGLPGTGGPIIQGILRRGASAAGGEDDRSSRRGAPRTAPTSTMGKAWKWFKKNILADNS